MQKQLIIYAQSSKAPTHMLGNDVLWIFQTCDKLSIYVFGVSILTLKTSDLQNELAIGYLLLFEKWTCYWKRYLQNLDVAEVMANESSLLNEFFKLSKGANIMCKEVSAEALENTKWGKLSYKLFRKTNATDFLPTLYLIKMRKKGHSWEMNIQKFETWFQF